MSTIVCLVEEGHVCLGTDSRFMTHDYSGIASDAVPKITELGGDAFLATSGRAYVCDFQAQRARELVRELNSCDVRVIAEALDRASQECLRKLAVSLSTEWKDLPGDRDSEGWMALHGFLLAGRSRGQLGYRYTDYWHKGGQVKTKRRVEYFGRERQIEVSSGKPVHYLSKDPRTWLYPPVDVVQFFLAEQRRINPHIGGSDQIVLIDRSGARWISRLPAPELAPAELAHATINASISMTAATLTGSTLTLNQNGLTTTITNGIDGALYNGVKVYDNSLGRSSHVAAGNCYVRNRGGVLVGELHSYSGAGNGAGYLGLNDASGSRTVSLDGATGEIGCSWIDILNSGYSTRPIRLGSYVLWIDSSGRLRVKFGDPTSDTDGTVVGTQT